jgi:4,5:9,10-diseco-3-hydroxy-5,9,17-trioxoandrosta-1(10),2-diene-4-oate hydrolase
MNAPTQQALSTSTTLDVQGRHIHLTDAGHGPALLMLHGGGPGASGMSNYSRNVFPLAERFRVIVPDLPGYGASSKGINPQDPFGDLAASMFGLLDALQLERAHVMGNSLGGACALRMALDRPGRIDRLVLMGPGGVGISEGKPTAGLMRLLGYYQGEGPTLEKLRKFIREDLVYDSSRITESLLRERFEASIDPEVVANPPLRAPKDLEGFKRLDFLLDPRLPELDNRTLVLWGTEDRVNPASGACALQQRMRNCDVYLFSRTGHWVQWERAHEFNNVVATFLNADHA